MTPAFSLHRERRRPNRWPGSSGGADRFVLCDPAIDAKACGLLQSSHVSHAESDWQSPSGLYRTNRDHLRTAATEALEMISGRDCAALDIGCGDGALLSFFPRWVERYGADPSADIDHIGEWAETVDAPFPSNDFDAKFGDKQFDIITAISVLEELDAPAPFFTRAKELLTEDGVIVLETLYAPMMLTRNSVEAFMGRAAAIFSLSVLERMVRDGGLKIFRGDLTDKEGGSIRLFLTHANYEGHDFDPWYQRLARLWDEENALALRAIQPYQALEVRLEEERQKFISLLEEAYGEGRTVHILGADAEALSLLQWAGSASQAVTFAVDASGVMVGKKLGPGGPKVINETDCRAAQPDFLIAPARLKREMLERWRDTILVGGKMIFATPSPHLVTSANYAAEFGKSLAGGDGPGGVETLRAILDAAGGPRLVAQNEKTALAG